MRRAELGLGLVWIASAAPLFLELQESWDRDLSLSALALLPWLAWATLPRRAADARGDLALAPWLALPLLVLALALDRAREQTWSAALVAGLGSSALALLFALAAARSATARGPRALYAAAWFALVFGAPALSLALESVGAPLYGRASPFLEFLGRLSPFTWWRSVLHAPENLALAALPWWPAGLAALLLLVARRARAEAA